MASSAISVVNSSLRVCNKGFSEFSGLNSSSASLPFARRTPEDLVAVVAFQTSAVAVQRGSEGSRKGAVEAKLKVAINGFGRIGRNFLRCWHGRKDSPLDVVALNDTGGVKQASHLLKYDSTLGTFEADVKPVGDDAISVDGKIIKVVSNRNPINLPWKDMNIDLVIEGTGVFVDREGAGKHLEAGAKKVLITAPGKGDIPTYVVGVNEDAYSPAEPILSNASCTTNCLAPFVKNLWGSINRQQRNRSFASTAGPSHALPSKSWMKRANLAPVYIVMGMVTVAATIGAHTAKQQLFHSPSVSVNKKKRETIPEVDTPTRVVNSADKFISKSFLRKVANIQDESRQTMPNPIRGDILASPRRAETLESSGA